MNPVLVSCRACTKTISVNAAACPHCGEPIRPHQVVKPTNWVKITGGLLMIFGVIGCAAQSMIGGFMMVVGFVLFVIGRFRD